MTASMTDSGDRRSLIATFTPSSFSSNRRPTIIGRFTTRVTVASIVSSSAAAAARGRASAGESARRPRTNARLSRVMSAPLSRGPRGGERRGHDVLVAGAAAQVAGDGLADLRLRRVGALAQEASERHQEAGGAEAALQAVVLAKRLLQRVERLAVGQPLDGLDRVAVHLGREQQARSHSGAVDDDGARPAHAVLAAEVGAREVEVVAQEVRQGLAHLDGLLVGPSVDGDADRPLDHRRSPVEPRPPARSAARARARRVSTEARCLRYSLDACRSPSGSTPAATRLPASSNAAGASLAPTRARAASRATTGVGPTPVSAIAPAVQTPASSIVSVTATPTRAKSPWRRLTSRNALPVRGGVTGRRTSTRSSSGAAAVVRYPTKNCSGVSTRRPRALWRTSSPPSAATTAGSSAAGSPWARLPPIVPRFRICVWPICGSASARSGQRSCTSADVSTARWRVIAPMQSRPSATRIPSRPATSFRSTR